MASSSFIVDLEQEEKPPPGEEPEEKEETSQEVLAWEINFPSGNDHSKKKPSMPRFLRDRERPQSSTILPIKSNSGTRVPSRSSSSPLKASGPKPPASRLPSKSNTSPPRPNSSPRRQSTEPVISLSPKKSPTIKKPLLPVLSPSKKHARSLDMKSRSECCLTPSKKTTDGKGAGINGAKKKRPHSATASLGVSGRGNLQRGNAVQKTVHGDAVGRSQSEASMNEKERRQRSKEKGGQLMKKKMGRSETSMEVVMFSFYYVLYPIMFFMVSSDAQG